jgi:hypothetical protein
MTKYSDDELLARMKSPGWHVATHEDEKPAAGSLEDAVRAAHDRHSKGEAPGLIQEIETSIELDMIAIEKLWRYLGLPV